jgi:SAM-dependent methyltransferase
VVAFEPDERMAALARRATSGHPVQVEERPFEDWDGEAGSFDLVVSAQAWHWIDPERGPALARRALRPRGVLAVWWNHVSDREWPLHEAIDAVYREHAPELVQSIVNKSIHSREGDVMIEGFEPPERRSYEWKQPYDADAYGELLRTHSDHRLLAPERLEPVVLAITDVINREGGGELIYPYRTDLLFARRTAGR